MISLEQTQLGRGFLFDPREFSVHLLETLMIQLGRDACALELFFQLDERLFVLLALALEVFQVFQATLYRIQLIRLRIFELLQ